MKNFWIIQVFALLHAAVSFCCRAAGIGDDLLLTLLTMLMVALICYRRGTAALYMSVALLVANVVGFLLGEGVALLFGLVSLPAEVVHPLATLICTEIMGLFVDRFATPKTAASYSSRGFRIILLAFVLTIILRLVISLATHDVLSSTKFRLEMALTYVFSCLTIVLVVEYALRFHDRAEKAAAEANLSEYRYLNLKQQVNPHFLFNSLNILDCIIQGGSMNEASEFTHKLADIYRYMLRNDGEVLVTLRDEMRFVSLYMDLIRVRYTRGVELEVDIPEEVLSRKVVPCGVQFLVENATKHNAVTPEKPLKIRIYTTEDSIVVTNNLIPRMTPVRSSGLGQKYLMQRYMNLAGKQIAIDWTEDRYTVILPLL